MGYLFPGILTLFLLQSFMGENTFSIKGLLDLEQIRTITNNFGESFSLESSIICIVLSYTIGHIMSYMSSITVEYFSNKVFGYPSEYLMSEERNIGVNIIKRYFIEDSRSDDTRLINPTQTDTCNLKTVRSWSKFKKFHMHGFNYTLIFKLFS